MIYNFRFDRSKKDEIIRRLKEENSLSQGWGGGSKKLNLNKDDFVIECKKHYKLPSTHIPNNLLRMRKFNDGDLLVTPHLPEHGKVAIHVIDGDFNNSYSYLNDDDTHLNHRIKLKKSYGLDSNISIYNVHLIGWYRLLKAYRFPILPIEQFEHAFKEIINKLEEEPDFIFTVSELDDFFYKQLSDLLINLKNNLYNIKPSSAEISFEKVCERLLVSHGYEIIKRNYHSNGGDVDLYCIRNRSDQSPFEDGQTTLFVQIKKHKGTTGEKGVNQLLDKMKQHPEADGCLMSLADDFTEQAKDLAKQNGVLLMNGDAICNLMLELLSSMPSELD